MNLSDDKAFRREHAVDIEKLAGNLRSLGLDINASRARDAAVSQLKAVTRLFGIWHGVENPESPTMFDCERWILNTHGYKHAIEFLSALHSADKKKRVELQKRLYKHQLKERGLPLWADRHHMALVPSAFSENTSGLPSFYRCHCKNFWPGR